jgi:DNA-binding phage protein
MVRQEHATPRHRAGQAHGEGLDDDRTITVTYAAFDVSDYLDKEDVIAQYLSLAAQNKNPDVRLSALAHVAKARGLARAAGRGGSRSRPNI